MLVATEWGARSRGNGSSWWRELVERWTDEATFELYASRVL